MKYLRNLLNITCLLTLTMLLGCSKPGLTIDNGQVCFSAKTGGRQCKPIGGKQMVLMAKNGETIALNSLTVDEAYVPEKQGKIAVEKMLHDELKARKMLLSEDSKLVDIAWEGDHLTFSEKGATHTKNILNTADSVVVLLMQEEGSSIVDFALVQAQKCNDPFDLDRLVPKVGADVTNVASEMTFAPSDGGKILVKLPGGLIVVIDPAVGDPLFLRAFRQAIWEAKIREMGNVALATSISQRGIQFMPPAALTLPLVTANQALDAPQAPNAPNAPLPSMDTARVRAMIASSTSAEMVCQFPGDSQVDYYCGQLRVMDPATNRVLLSMPILECNVVVGFADQITIYCNRECLAAFPDAPCKPVGK